MIDNPDEHQSLHFWCNADGKGYVVVEIDGPRTKRTLKNSQPSHSRRGKCGWPNYHENEEAFNEWCAENGV